MAQEGQEEKGDIHHAALLLAGDNEEMPSSGGAIGLNVWKLVQQKQVADQEEGNEGGDKRCPRIAAGEHEIECP